MEQNEGNPVFAYRIAGLGEQLCLITKQGRI